MLPKLMATQHPDSIHEVPVEKEVGEAIADVTPIDAGGFGCDEKMVDYEGKLTPYHQMKWIIKEAKARGLKPGADFLITPRIPSASMEDPDRHLLALVASISANAFSEAQPVRYVIYPMSNEEEIRRFKARVSRLTSALSGDIPIRDDIRPIPLVESIQELLSVERYLGVLEEGDRIMLGKSDSALEAGHIASTIALLRAIQTCTEGGLNVIVGVGKPPFRGHLREGNESAFVALYSGYGTVTIQSALRFQTERKDYERVWKVLRSGAGGKPRGVDDGLLHVIPKLEQSWKRSVLRIVRHINAVAEHVPSTRARMVTYRRSVNGIAIPRAIKFVASLYTLGVPPLILELAGAVESGIWREVSEVLGEIKELWNDIKFDAGLTYPSVAERYGLEVNVLKLKSYIDIEFGSDEEYEAVLMVALRKVKHGRRAGEEIGEAAKIRGFLG